MSSRLGHVDNFPTSGVYDNPDFEHKYSVRYFNAENLQDISYTINTLTPLDDPRYANNSCKMRIWYSARSILNKDMHAEIYRGHEIVEEVCLEDCTSFDDMCDIICEALEYYNNKNK